MTASIPLPPELDPRYWLRTGASVIERGLPELPDVLSYQMSIPICQWKASRCAVVMFLQFHRSSLDSRMRAMTSIVTYSRDRDSWTTPMSGSRSWQSYAFDPIATPSYSGHLDGNAITYGQTTQHNNPGPGQPASTAHGYVGPEVKYLAIIQDGRQDLRPLQSHFGAWIACTEQPGTFDVAAFDRQHALLARLAHPFPLPRHPKHRS
jgi:hypothetical protein